MTGKGGVGKTTIAAGLSVIYSKEKKVIAMDADPDSNLAETIGFPDPEKIIPISKMNDLINERTEAKNGFFKMNPKVDDIPEKFCPEYKNIRLLNMGSIKKGGSGCFCPENAFIKTLISHLLLQRDEFLIMDMPAGIENLSRGTAFGVDILGFIGYNRNLRTARGVLSCDNSVLSQIEKIKNVLEIKNER